MTSSQATVESPAGPSDSRPGRSNGASGGDVTFRPSPGAGPETGKLGLVGPRGRAAKCYKATV